MKAAQVVLTLTIGELVFELGVKRDEFTKDAVFENAIKFLAETAIRTYRKETDSEPK